MQANEDKKRAAKELYESGENLILIAQKLEIKESTLRSWKRRGKWEQSATPKTLQKMQSKKASERQLKKELGDDAEKLVENNFLTSNQKLFCMYYVTCFNATKAYQKAYKCSRKTAGSNGYRMLKNAEIKKCIRELKENRLNKAMLNPSDIFQKYIDIAFSDITDFVEFGSEKSEDGIRYDYMRFKSDAKVDGTLIAEISMGQTKKIKLEDRQKALAWLADHMDLATEEQKAQVEYIKSKIAAVNKALTGEGAEIEDVDDLEEEIYGSTEE